MFVDGMSRRVTARRFTAVTGLLALLVTGVACDRNVASTLLVPTGLRPRPATGTGAIVGRVVYDPGSPDLDSAPYPPTIVELFESGIAVATDTLDRQSRNFEFVALPPGTYTVVANARLFQRSSLPAVRVVAERVDVGDLEVSFDLSQLTTTSIHVSGDFNDFAEFADSCSMQQLRLGLWFGPHIDAVNADPPDTALTLTAGVHRMRFITNYTIFSPFYVSERSDVIDAPATQVPMRLATDPATDMSINFPVTGRYRFYLDERRVTLTIEQLPASAAFAARRISR